MLKRFIRYYRPHRKMLALDMLAALLISVIGMVYPIVTNKMLNEYIPQKQYEKIWMYIENNPLRWEKDCFYIE